MSLALVYENFADQAGSPNLSGGQWQPTLPLANLVDTDPGLPARSAGAAPAATQFTINLGKAQPVGAIVLGPTNLTVGATYRARAYTDLGLTQLVFDSGTIIVEGNQVDWSNPATWLEWEDPNFWSGITPTDAAELPLYAFYLVPAGQTGAAQAQFWRIEISNPDNPDGYVEIGRLFLGRLYRPSMNYAYDGNDFGIEPLTDITESLGGSETFQERGGPRRTFRAAWPLLPETEVFTDWVRIALRSGVSRQVFVVPEESDDPEMQRKRAFLARCTATPRIAQTLFERAATSIDLREVS